ncbi:alpha/beta fold hydrolase [Chryseobacterium sp. IT-36CA2]|uniref:alpha/beta fold hydrolase n=1 Tax=Chryseobacterium sp. IT-36CA2 TaxID=3026460 RepID=UPI0039DF8682
MKKIILTTVIVLLSIFNNAKAQTNLNFIGKTFNYQIDNFHLNLEILSDKQAKWTYISAPNNETGKTAVENCKIEEISNGIYKIYWTEKDGSNVVDIFNLNTNEVFVAFTSPNNKLYNYKTSFKIISEKSENMLTIEKVNFKSNNQNVVGLLCKNDNKKKKPAVVILGPICSVKEQSPIQYATRLSEKGFVALCFDARGYGESEGQPRQFESLNNKEEDVKAAIDFLISRNDVDADKIFVIGICNGTNEIMQVSIDDKRIKRIALVSGNYLIKENMVHLLGNEKIWDAHLQRAKLAKEKFEKTGETDYIKIIDSTGNEQLLPPLPIYEWYHPWENKVPYFTYRGGWQNKVTAMSEWETLNFDALYVAKKISKPTLLIHGEMSDGGYEYAKQIFNSILTKNKKSIWMDKTVHFQFYDDPRVIGQSVNEISKWFKQGALL